MLVDGEEVYRWRPWRDDCGEFRAVNPYCAKWSDGSWSSDYSRSGWCPGDVAAPEFIDLSEWLTPGTHTLTWRVEDIRPKDPEDEDGAIDGDGEDDVSEQELEMLRQLGYVE